MATTDGITQVRLQYSHTWCMRVCGSLWMAVGFMHVYVPCAGIAFCKHRMPCAGTSLVHLHCLAQALLCIDNWRIAFRRHCFSCARNLACTCAATMFSRCIYPTFDHMRAASALCKCIYSCKMIMKARWRCRQKRGFKMNIVEPNSPCPRMGHGIGHLRQRQRQEQENE